MTRLLFLVFALCCFAFGAWQSPTNAQWPRILCVGLAFLVASMISW